METTTVYWGVRWDNGKENGNYYSILGVRWDNGKENGNYYSVAAPVSWQFRTEEGLAIVQEPPRWYLLQRCLADVYACQLLSGITRLGSTFHLPLSLGRWAFAFRFGLVPLPCHSQC